MPGHYRRDPRRLVGHARHGADGLVVIAGVWTLFSPGINYAGAHGSRTNDIAIGIIVIVLGIANALYRQSPVRTSA